MGFATIYSVNVLMLVVMVCISVFDPVKECTDMYWYVFVKLVLIMELMTNGKFCYLALLWNAFMIIMDSSLRIKLL